VTGEDDLGALLEEELDGGMEVRMRVSSVMFWPSSSSTLRSA
jgi:hypothetical protein